MKRVGVPVKRVDAPRDRWASSCWVPSLVPLLSGALLSVLVRLTAALETTGAPMALPWGGPSGDVARADSSPFPPPPGLFPSYADPFVR